MKKSTYLLTLLLTALFCLPWGSTAWADELTVADGTSRSGYLPFYGNYTDASNLLCQSLYLKDELADLANTNITKLTFYTDGESDFSWDGHVTFTVSMAEVEETAINSTLTPTLTEVYSGGLSIVSTLTTINFPDAFYYSGDGNLLIEIKVISTDKTYHNAYYLGVSTGGNWDGYYAGRVNYNTSSTGYKFRPKTTFTYEAAAAVTCAKPSDLTNTALSASSATFTWTAGGSESEWQYICLPAATAVDWESASVQTTTSATATVGLSPTTDYKFYVRANCGATDGVSKEISVAFTTPCATLVAPVTTIDFEDGTNNTLYPCWDNSGSTFTNTASESYYAWGVFSYGGNKMLRMDNYDVKPSSGSNALINSPSIEIPNDGKNYELIFDYEHSSNVTTNGNLVVKISEDGGSNFTEIGSYAKNSTANYAIPTNFTEATISLADYAGKTVVLQFFARANYGNGAIFLDNVRVKAATACAKPSALTCTAVEANSATLTWTNGGSETAWKIRYKAVGVSEWTEVAADVNPFTLTGLSANTNYTAQVLADCGGGDLSDWNSTPATFKTACGAIASTSLPWSYGFEDVTPGSGEYIIPDCWTRIPDDDNTSVRINSYYTTYARTGTKCLWFYGGTASGTYGPKTVVLPAFEENIANLTIEFYYKTSYTGDSYGSPKVGYINTEGTFVSLKTLDKKTNYTFADFAFPASYEDTPANIAIQFAGGTSASNMYIDDITVKKTPDCVKPTNLACNATTANTATLSWTKGKNETAWKVQYSTSATFASDNVEVDANSNSAFELTGLTANTLYYVHVQAACESEYSDDISFRTDCEAITSFPWSEDFTDFANGSVPTCWDNSASTATMSYASNGPVNWNVFSASGNNMIRMNNHNSSGTAISVINTPTIQLPSDKEYELSFDCAHTATCGNLSVKISTDNGSSFTEIKSIAKISGEDYENGTTVGTIENQIISLASYKGQAVKFQFYAQTNAGYGIILVDNVAVRKATTCFAPALGEASAITPDGATFTWTASGKGETQYQYTCVPTGETPNWDAATKTSALTATVSGKAAGTYDFYVRSWCSESDQSEAVSKSFTTATVPAPTGVAVTGITNNGASASWTAPDVTYPVQYQWKTSNTGSVWSTPSSDLSAALSGLEANTDYTFYVRTYYSASLQSAEATQVFHTACEAVTVDATHPFAEDFNGLTTAGEIPSCWDNSEVVLVPYASAPTAARKWSYFATGHEGRCVRYNSEDVSSGVVNVLATPQIILNADADLTFWAKNPNGGDYKVQISVNGGDRTDLLTGLTGIADWTKQEAPLTYPAGTKIQLFFVGTSNYGNSSSYLYLDDVQINPISCRKPAADPVVDSKDAVSATISWPAVAGAAKYQFSLVERDAAPVWEDANTVTTTSKELTGLQPSTSYDFYVRTYCDAESQSEARKVSFRTGCGVITALPWEENFESVTLEGNIPECWASVGDLVSPSYEWKHANYSGKNSSKGMQCGLVVEEAGKQNILATPSIQLGTGNVLSFWCKNIEGDNFVVEISKDGGTTKTQLLDLTAVMTDWTLKYADLSAYDNKEVILYFKATSAGDYAGDMIYIDNVRVARGEFFDDAAASGVADRIAGLEGETLDFIMNRPMQFEGSYNTLCLPFDLSAAELADADCPLYRNTVKVFDYARVASNELQLAIAGASDIRAGVPCFVKYDGAAGEPRRLFLFKDVTIKTGLNPKADGAVEYRGIYDPVAVTAEQDNGPHHYIFVGAENQLYWPGTDRTMRGFRAYFHVGTEDLAGNPIKRGIPARLVERTDTATGIGEISGQPSDTGSQKVLENSRIVIIRNGVKYNVQGQLIEKR